MDEPQKLIITIDENMIEPTMEEGPDGKVYFRGTRAHVEEYFEVIQEDENETHSR